jgi:alcohol dehydrogenase/L-iditol 2-dehydrogenase
VKAALLVRPGELVVDDVADPTVGPDDVLIAVGGVGLCGSDLSVFSGRWPSPEYPWVMGHEAFGTIVEVGARVPSERVGETVVVEPNIADLTCDRCRAGWTSTCTGRQSVGMNRQGALAERLVVPGRFAWPMPGVEPADLVCVEPTTVVLAAIRRLGGVLPTSALVVGVGAQGLLMSLVLLERGVAVDVFDLNPDRLAFAAGLGAGPLQEGEGRSYPLVVDTVGSPGSFETSLGHAEVGGTILILGLDGRPLEVTAQTLVRRQLTVRGSLTYDHPDDFQTTVSLVSEGHFRPGRIVGHVFPLEEAQTAFEHSPEAIGKTWIRPGEDRETA